MALITVDDLKPEVSGMTISPTSKPSEDDVSGYIDEIEGEVRALWLGCGATWPDDIASDAGTFLRLTLLLGTKWRFLDAKYTLTSATMSPDSLAQARAAYNDRLKRLCSVAAGADAAAHPDSVTGAPKVGHTGPPAVLVGASFAEYTERRDLRVRRNWPYTRALDFLERGWPGW